jgi:hypothetical protein
MARMHRFGFCLQFLRGRGRAPSRLTMKRRLFWALVLFGGGPISWADQASVRISVEVQGGECEGVARRLSSAGKSLWEGTSKFPSVLELPSLESASRFEVSCPGFWGPSLELPVGGNGGAETSLRLVPAGSVVGKLTAAPEVPLPTALSVRIVRPRSGVGQAKQPLLQTCEVEGLSFRCPLPAQKLDGALIAPGFAPFYFWGLEVKRSVAQNLGSIRLAEGASVAGWVVAPSPGPFPIIVEIAPETTGWISDPAAQRARLLTAHQAADERGFFQLSGLAGGAFRLRAKRADGAQSDRMIEVRDGEEYLLAQPLQLDLPITFEAIVTPAIASGRPLLCLLERVAPRSNVVEHVARAKVDLGGNCAAEKIESGRYTFRVVDDAGNTFHVSEVEVEPGLALLSVVLDLVEVHGVVTFGDGEPFQGEIIFGGKHRQPNVSVSSDEEGRFTAVLPRDGEWPIDVVDQDSTHRGPTVDVQRRLDREPTWIDIELPGAVLTGTVREKGKPVADAIVLARRSKEGRLKTEAHTKSRKDGTFRLRGVRPGELELRGYTQTSASRWIALQLTPQEKSAEIDLDLSAQIEVAVEILGPRGSVSGAYVQAFPVIQGNSKGWVHRGTTDVNGQLAWNDVDGLADALDFLIVAAGYGTRLLRVPLVPKSKVPLRIALDDARGALVLGKSAFAEGQDLLSAGARISVSAIVSTLNSNRPRRRRQRRIDSGRPNPWHLFPLSRDPGLLFFWRTPRKREPISGGDAPQWRVCKGYRPGT